MKRGERLGRLAQFLGWTGLALVSWVVVDLVWQGLGHLSWHFLSAPPREAASGGGIGPELLNSLAMVGMAEVISWPLAWAAAIWRVDYAVAGWQRQAFDTVTLAFQSLPGIVLALVLFSALVVAWGWPLSVATGAVALAVFNWPVAAVLCQEAMANVSEAWREGSLALGATRFQTLTRIVIPAALPELATGFGLSLARLSGETALLLFTAGVNVGPHWGWWQPGESLAVHLWYVRTEGLMPDREVVAAATGTVLLAWVAVAVLGGRWLSRRLARHVAARRSR